MSRRSADKATLETIEDRLHPRMTEETWEDLGPENPSFQALTTASLPAWWSSLEFRLQ